LSKTRPRYRELADELRGEITGGAGVDGFPTEAELTQRYSVSRFTVREALRLLENEGLIRRKRGSGTVVMPAAARGGALHQPLSNVQEILQYARGTQIDFAALGATRLPAPIARELGLPREAWSRFRGIRTVGGDARPIAVTDAYLHGHLAGITDAIASGDTIFRQVERLAGLKVAIITQDIQAVRAGSDVAEALGVRRSAAVLRILRCYFDDTGRLFEISASHHPGDRFAYNMHIEVDGA